MKFNFDIKNRKAGIEADIEKLVEKGMDNNEKNWKEKFEAKHNAKKELLEMKHTHKMEINEKNQYKKSFIQKIQEENIRKKQIQLEEKRKNLKIRIIISITMAVIGLIMMIVGGFLGETSENSNSSWYMVEVLGIFLLLGSVAIWLVPSSNKK